MDAATLRVPGCSVVAQRRSGGLAEGHTTQCSRRLLHFAIVTEQAANLKAVQPQAASLRAFAADHYRPHGRSRRRSVPKPGRSRAGLFGVASVGTAGRGGGWRLRNAELRQARTATAVHAVTAAGMTPRGVTSRRCVEVILSTQKSAKLRAVMVTRWCRPQERIGGGVLGVRRLVP